MNVADLKGVIHSMMDDSGDDDDDDAGAPQDSSGLLQTKTGNKALTDAYMDESANALSASLGPRWNGKELERDAKAKKKAFLDGIAGPEAQQKMGGMMSMMMALR